MSEAMDYELKQAAHAVLVEYDKWRVENRAGEVPEFGRLRAALAAFPFEIAVPFDPKQQVLF